MLRARQVVSRVCAHHACVAVSVVCGRDRQVLHKQREVVQQLQANGSLVPLDSESLVEEINTRLSVLYRGRPLLYFVRLASALRREADLWLHTAICLCRYMETVFKAAGCEPCSLNFWPFRSKGSEYIAPNQPSTPPAITSRGPTGAPHVALCAFCDPHSRIPGPAGTLPTFPRHRWRFASGPWRGIFNLDERSAKWTGRLARRSGRTYALLIPSATRVRFSALPRAVVGEASAYTLGRAATSNDRHSARWPMARRGLIGTRRGLIGTRRGGRWLGEVADGSARSDSRRRALSAVFPPQAVSGVRAVFPISAVANVFRRRDEPRGVEVEESASVEEGEGSASNERVASRSERMVKSRHGILGVF